MHVINYVKLCQITYVICSELQSYVIVITYVKLCYMFKECAKFLLSRSLHWLLHSWPPWPWGFTGPFAATAVGVRHVTGDLPSVNHSLKGLHGGTKAT